nr:MAG TPA: hypothetical protein [Caudoviricetes sp.]
MRVTSGLSGTVLKSKLSKKSVRFCTDFFISVEKEKRFK